MARPPVNPKIFIILRGELLFWGELGYWFGISLPKLDAVVHRG